MWIKTKDGRLHDASQCTIDPNATIEGLFQILLVPRTGKPVVLIQTPSVDAHAKSVSYIEGGLANGRLLIQLE